MVKYAVKSLVALACIAIMGLLYSGSKLISSNNANYYVVEGLNAVHQNSTGPRRLLAGRSLVIDDVNVTKKLDSKLQQNSTTFTNLVYDNDDVYVFNYLNKNDNYELHMKPRASTYLRGQYNRDTNSLDFVLPSYELAVNGNKYKTKAVPLASIPGIQLGYVVRFANGSTIKINETDQISVEAATLFGDRGIQIFRQNVNKAVVIDEFEDTSSKLKIENCSEYLPGKPLIGGGIRTDALKGGNVLQLTSKNHFACAYKKIALGNSAHSVYELTFDYRAVKGSEVRYVFNLENEDNENSVADNIELLDKSWHSQSTLKYSDDITKNAEVYLYAPSYGSGENTNHYDNLKLNVYEIFKNLVKIYLFWKEADFYGLMVDFKENVRNRNV